MVRKPNVTDLARYPFYPLRYYIMTENVHSEKTGMYKTHRTTEAAFRSMSFTDFRIVDLISGKVSKHFKINEYGRRLLLNWRHNYFDPEYDLEESLFGEVPDEE